MEMVKWRLECGTTKPYFWGDARAFPGFHCTTPLGLYYSYRYHKAKNTIHPITKKLITEIILHIRCLIAVNHIIPIHKIYSMLHHIKTYLHPITLHPNADR